MIAREKSIPVFAASIPMSPATASSCARTNAAGTSCTAFTSRVFCAVSATIAGHAVDAGGGKCLEVGLDPGPSAGIGAGDRDAAWNQLTPFAGMTRIRFDGCDLSRGCGTPVPER